MQTLPLHILSQGQSVQGFFHRPTDDPQTPCVILCHGLMSSMESPKFRLLAKALSGEGINAVRFDFRGCGASEGDLRETTVSGRVGDLQAVLTHLREQVGLRGPFGLLGSSMGGYVALLTFAMRQDIEAVCVWATPFEVQALREARDHPDLSSLGQSFYDDLSNHDLASSGHMLHHVLVLHGACDKVIPQSHAFRIYARASGPKAIHIFTGGDHRFTDPAHRSRATELSLEWFQNHLKRP